jgi:hypothetical protein
MSILRLIAPIVCALAIAGCDMTPPGDDDAGPRRDASYADGGGLLDGGIPHDASTKTDSGGVHVCEVGRCNPQFPVGCGEESCVLWDETPSCGTAGLSGPGADCISTMDCAAGLACFRRESGYGICGRICCPGGDTCVEGSICGGAGVLVDGTETSWGECLPPRMCDVLRPELVCAEREGCYIVDSAGTTECRVAGSAAAGDPCELQEDCAAGLFCGGIGALRCVQICMVGGDECPAEERCVRQAHSPEGTGFCTFDASQGRP